MFYHIYGRSLEGYIALDFKTHEEAVRYVAEHVDKKEAAIIISTEESSSGWK